MNDTKTTAAQTAGMKLDAIAMWAKLTCAMSVCTFAACAFLALVVAGSTAYGLSEYLRFKSALAAASETFELAKARIDHQAQVDAQR